MKVNKSFAAVWMLAAAVCVLSQTADDEVLRRGVNFMPTAAVSAEEDAALLRLYTGLRVADVSDGLDRAGLPDARPRGPVHPSAVEGHGPIHPPFLRHRRDARYVPTQRRRLPGSGADIPKWEGDWYNDLSSEAWTRLLRPGSVVVIDDAENSDVGTIGSSTSWPGIRPGPSAW